MRKATKTRLAVRELLAAFDKLRIDWRWQAKDGRRKRWDEARMALERAVGNDGADEL